MNSITLISNATLVNEGSMQELDVLIKDGKIERIDREIAAPSNARVIDASGLHLLPGLIDDQVHFREPGLTHKGNIYTESRAAVAGGVTSFMDMPNTRPTTTSHEELEKKYAIASSNSAANFGFYFGATNDNIEAIRTLDPAATCGVKVFMGSSTGNMLVDDEKTLTAIFKDSPVVIATHCESTPMIEANLKAAQARFGNTIPVTEHARIRSADTCYASTLVAVNLARQHQAHLHVLHVSTAAELELFEPGPLDGKSITAETCIHFLHFTDADYATHGNRIKCNPAVKSQADQDGLFAGLASGRLDILATDHAPHTAEEKASDDYLKAPAGLPLVQDLLLAAIELVHCGRLELATVVEKAAHNPAIRFGVDRRGFLREGYWADLVLVDLQGSTPVTPGRVLSRCGWSPFEGRTFSSSIHSTMVNGCVAYADNRIHEHRAARRLDFNRVRF